jgi:hypothetical protein
MKDRVKLEEITWGQICLIIDEFASEKVAEKIKGRIEEVTNLNDPFRIKLILLEEEAMEEFGFSEIMERSKNSAEIDLLGRMISYNSKRAMESYLKKYRIPIAET